MPINLLNKDLGQLRKLSTDTLQHFGIANAEDGWIWPTVGLNGGRALRWKSYYRRQEDVPEAERGQWAKYRWKPKKPDAGFEYYSPGGLRQAIAEDGGTLHIVGGEVDVHTMYEAGLPNTTCFFGEGNVPKTLAADLRAWGVTHVWVYPDRDSGGLNAAIKIRDLLRDSGIKLYVKQLPFEFQPKRGQDVSDLWLAWTGSKAGFRLHLLDIPDWPLPDPQEARSSRALTPTDIMGSEELPEVYKAACLKLLNGQAEFGSDGFTRKNVKCPFHDDQTASASWHAAGFLYCHTEGKSYNGKTVGEHFNLRLADYYPNPSTPARQNGSTPNGAGRDTPQPLADLFVSRRQATRDYLQTLQPEYVTKHPPVLNPITSLHPLGGMARVLEPGKFWIVVGGSGTGKTNYLESLIIEPLLRDGINLITAGGEWKPVEVVGRSAQRHGGMSRNTYALHQLYKYQQQRGVPQAQWVMDGNVSQEDLRYTETIAHSQLSWAGEQWMIPSSALGIVDMVAVIRRKVLEAAAPIRLLVIDYLQMYLHNLQMPFMEQLWYLKNHLEPASDFPGLILIGASQITKESAKLMRVKDKTLDSADAQEIREDPANLVITLKPGFKRLNNKEKTIVGYEPWGDCRVVKNSEGKPGLVKLGMELNHLRWLDTIVDPEADAAEVHPF